VCTLSDQITSKNFKSITEVIWALREHHPNESFFIHWDEVESIQNLYDNSSTSFPEEMLRYYELWEELKDTLKLDNCFHILTSKSTAFSLIGLQLIRNLTQESPSVPMPFLLGPLLAEHIKLIVENTYMLFTRENSITETVSLAQRLEEMKISDLDRQYFYDTLIDRTGGVPRLVRESLRNVIDSGLILETRSKIVHLIDGQVFSHIQTVCGKEISLDGGLDSRVASMLVLFATLKISFPRTFHFVIGGKKIPLLRLVTVGNIYVKSTDNNMLMLVMPQFAIRYFQEKNVNGRDIVMGLSHALLGGEIIDKGKLLERGLLYALIIQLLAHLDTGSGSSDWASLFDGSIFSNSKVLRDVPVRLLLGNNDFVKLLPKVTSNRKSALSLSDMKALKTTPGKVNLNREQFSQMLPNLLPPYCSAFTASKSGTSDLMMRADTSKFCNVASKFTHQVGVNIIQEEIDKGSMVLETDDKVEVCLVVACASVCKYIDDATPDTGALVLSSGIYKFEAGECVRVKDSEKQYHTVPPIVYHCLCKLLLDEDMIQCDNCDKWFHLKCLNIHDHQTKDYDKFYCNTCSKKLHSTYRGVDDDCNDDDYYNDNKHDEDSDDEHNEDSDEDFEDIPMTDQSTTSDSQTIDVPHRMEVIILNTKGLETWIGAETLQVYKDVTNESDKTNNDITNALVNMLAPVLPGYSRIENALVNKNQESKWYLCIILNFTCRWWIEWREDRFDRGDDQKRQGCS
jgi:hypothetical protein